MFRLLGNKIIAIYAQKFCLTGPMFTMTMKDSEKPRLDALVLLSTL